MKNRVTLKELSKLLNLSISTVSKSLNDSAEISQNTKKRVRDIAHLHNYIPNIAAQNLKKQQTNIIGVIVPSLQSSFLSAVLEGIEAKADELNYKIFLYISNESLEKEKECIKRFVESQVDGIIIFPSRKTQKTGDISHLNSLNSFRIPFVIFDHVLDILDCDRFRIDYFSQSELAVKELYAFGCRKIGFLTDLSDTYIKTNSRDGYSLAVKQLKLQGISIEDRNISFQKLAHLINKKRIDSVLVCSEYNAKDIMAEIRNADPNIIYDIPIVSFSNCFVSRNFLVSISSIDIKAKEQGQNSVKALVEKIVGNVPAENINYKISSKMLKNNRQVNYAYE